LVAGEQRPKEVRRTYARAVDIVNDKVQSLPYQNRTVLFELVKDKYEVTAAGEPKLPEADLAALAKKVGKQDAVMAYLPAEPVKVDQEWPIDIQKVAKLYGEVGTLLDIANSSGTAKLVKVYQSKGQYFGVIDLKMALAVRSMLNNQFNPPASL